MSTKSAFTQPDMPETQPAQGEMITDKNLPTFFIQMSGAPGSGKSTLARKLAGELRQHYGSSAVVINHDLIKSFFLDKTTTDLIKPEGNGDGTGIPFDISAKLSYRLDLALAEDMIRQGQRVIIVDSVCNYREAIDNGLEVARRYGYGYVYLECRVDNIGVLDGRLRGRAGGDRGVMSCQRGGVWERPAGAGGSGGDEVAGELFKKWMNPVRPGDGDGARVVVVDSRSGSVEECVDVVLRGLGLLLV